MRVFVSYSFVDKELYLLTLLVSKLREKGNFVQLSDGNYLSRNYINNSEMFVGIVTNNSHSMNIVLNEWEIAEKLNKERILLIEEGIDVYRNDIRFIRFNRYNPKSAIDQLMKQNEQKRIKKSNTIGKVVTAGVVVAGIAALISLLSKDDEK